MKSLVMALALLSVGVIGGIIISRHWLILQSTPGTVVESPTALRTDETQPEKIASPKPEPQRIVLENTNDTKPAPAAAATTNELKSANATWLSRAIDTLVSPRTSFQERQALWKQLREAGQLDETIEALKKGAANNPASPEYPTAIGEAQLQKAYSLSKSGGSVNEMGIAGMQADQAFDTALKLDPANWEAQFFKATSMSYWPAEMNKGPEVIQRLASLIDQQEKMTPQPQFAQTYLRLGDQYQKAGQLDYAEQTWKLGAAQFPTDQTLQKKLSNLPRQ